ncbi:uncharacterized protein LOC111698998 [Eurytemora carolleeae]|uniref:uncharacterized protein LOC111698998 n=1 Tax=Eurytemora carolleeae TaxID=1294199 RepID=UPI000C75B3BE|nr:uncharacterized protein LOC111698998 [Eurytemora carolleeae]|eukprot:XP_023325281.1 uncharacterized protein LOC111698998 [Eurytemora affinis]
MNPSCSFLVILIFLALEDTKHLVVCEDNSDIFEYYYVDGDNTTSEIVDDDAGYVEEYDDEEDAFDDPADFVYQDETKDVKFSPEGYSNGKGDYDGVLPTKNFTKQNAEILYSDKLYNTSKLPDPVQNLVKDSTKRALSEFKADEDLYNNPKFFKGFYKKWTPESVAAGKDARLLETAISSLENRSRTAGSDYSSQDYGTAEELKNVTKVDKIKLILNELLTLADNEQGQDYQDNGSGEEEQSKHTAQSCQRNSEIRCQPSSKYRAESGECNNLQNSLWGKANSAQTRLFPDLVSYEDGIGSPTATVTLKGQDRIYLPNPRLVSKRVHENKKERNIPSKKITHMAMQFGQFLDHELTLTPEPELECCAPEIISKSRCFPIRLNGKGMIDMETDEIHLLSKPRKHQNCIAFSRSDPACDTGTGDSVRQQLNSITGFIDGSAIYGSSAALTNHLR